MRVRRLRLPWSRTADCEDRDERDRSECRQFAERVRAVLEEGACRDQLWLTKGASGAYTLGMRHEVTHESEAHRFVVRELGHEAFLSYRELPGMVLNYAETQTPHEIRGRGIATAMIRFALDYARDNGYRVVPGCSFVRTYVDRHQEYSDLVAERPAPPWQ